MVSSYERDRQGGDQDEYLSFLSLSSLMQWDDGKVAHGIVWEVLPDVVVPASGWGQMSVGVLPGRWDVVVFNTDLGGQDAITARFWLFCRDVIM